MRLATGSALGQAVYLLFTPLLSRLYSPEDFGVVAVFFALTSVDVAVCLGYERALAVPRNGTEAAELAWIALASTAVIAAVTALAVAALAAGNLWPIVTDNGSWLPWTCGLGLVAYGVAQVGTLSAIRNQAYARVALAKFCQLGATGGAQALLGTSSLGAAGLILGHIGGLTICCLLLAGPLHRTLAGTHPRSLATLAATARRFGHFPAYVVPGQGINAVCLQVTPAALVGIFGATSGGLYSFAFRLIGAPLSVVTQAVSQTMLGIVSHAHRQGGQMDQVNGALRKALLSLILLAIPALVALMVAPSLFALVFGEAWRESGELLRLMIPMVLAQLLITPFHGLIDVLGRQDMHARREILRLILIGMALVAVVALDLSLAQAVLLVSLAHGGGYLFGAAIIRQMLQQLHPAAR